jgi:hypothetical protein
MTYRSLKILGSLFVVAAAGTITTGIMYQNEVRQLHVCTVLNVGNNQTGTVITANCGNGAIAYQQTTPLNVMKPVCLSNLVLGNCSTYNLNVLTVMLACGITINIFLSLMVILNLTSICEDCFENHRYQRNSVMPTTVQPQLNHHIRETRSRAEENKVDIPMHKLEINDTQEDPQKLLVSLAVGANDDRIQVIIKNPT